MKQKREKEETNSAGISQKTEPSQTTWDEYRDLLSRLGPVDVTVEKGEDGESGRFKGPAAYTDPTNGLGPVLNGGLMITYRGPRHLVIFPSCFRKEFLAQLRAELCQGNHLSERAFEILSEDEARELPRGDRERWRVPYRLYANLDMKNGNRGLVLRPDASRGCIHVKPRDEDDADRQKAMEEAGLL